jgi:hypothetical protein
MLLLLLQTLISDLHKLRETDLRDRETEKDRERDRQRERKRERDRETERNRD